MQSDLLLGDLGDQMLKSAHDRSFFLYSNGNVSPMKAMFVHEIDISGFVMLLLVMRNGTFCTTTIVRKKRGKIRACAEHTSVTDVTSGPYFQTLRFVKDDLFLKKYG
jgi:hypothetical protein